MSMTEERAAVLALTRATAGPWHHTARVVEARGSALRLVDGDFTGLDEEDRAHAARVRARLRPGDLAHAERLIASRPDLHLLTVLDAAYPGNLSSTYDLQPFLWTRGRLLESDYRSIAIVTGVGGVGGRGGAGARSGGAGGGPSDLRGAGGGGGRAHGGGRGGGGEGDGVGGRFDGDGSGRAAAVALADAGLTVVCDAGAPAGDAALSAGGRAIAVLPHGFSAAGITAEGITTTHRSTAEGIADAATAQPIARRGITTGAITTDATTAGGIAGHGITSGAIPMDGTTAGAIPRDGITAGAIPKGGITAGGIAEGGVVGLVPGGLVVVSVFWGWVGVTAGTVGVAQGVTSGLAAAVYVCDPGGGRRAAVALAQGKHVFAPPGMPWTSRVGYRGGVTVVAGIDDLVRQAVNLVDVTRLTTVF